MDNLAFSENSLRNVGPKVSTPPISVSNGKSPASTTTYGKSKTREKETIIKQSSSNAKYTLLCCLDFTIIGVVIAPLDISYFRGTWYLLNTFIFPDNFALSAGVSCAIGLALTLLINVLQCAMGTFFPKRTAIFHIVYRLYIYIYGFAVINHFRGLWYSLDHYTGVTILSASVCLGIAVLVLVPLRAVCNIAGTPMVTNVDIPNQPFRITTRFETRVSMTWRFFADVFLTVVVIISLVVVAWRGIWGLYDFYIFPSNKNYSAWTSLGIGYFIYIAVIVLEPPAWGLIRKTKRLCVRLIVGSTLGFVSGAGSILVWRGLWMVYDIYILPDYPETSYWVTHGVGIGGLFVLLAGRSALVTGCGVDGKEDGSTVRLGRYLQQICPKLVQKVIATERDVTGGSALPRPGNVEYEETRL